MVRSLWSQPDAGTVVQPQPSTLRLLLRNLQPFTSPDTLYTLVIHMPTAIPEQSCDPAVAVPTVLRCKVDDVPAQELFVVRDLQASSAV